MQFTYQDTVGLIVRDEQGAFHVPGGMTAIRFLICLMATGGRSTRL